MDGAKCETAKRTLLGARMSLQERAKQLNEIARMSEILIEKFERTEGSIKEGVPIDGEKKKQPDLIGMFEETSEEMYRYINKIGSNLERALNLVD